MDNCLFCRIVSREIPSRIVYEDELVLGFCDIAPKAPVHVLVIPKTHVASLNDLGKEHEGIMAHLTLAIPQVAEKMGIKDSGYRVVVNCGKDSGQEVAHLHYHILGGRAMENNFG
ncbi:MAG: histidine triad nucleotide-binding protein [Caldicoprobacterales bacterium]|jgi:histidine triad (HIT) family protein|nr:histidine triad nucleotide-binding protein [Clostridiales bacterium]